MPRHILLLLSIVAVFAVFAVPAIAAPVAEIPFRFTDGFICLEARVDKSGEPLTLLLDSGAGASVLSLKAAKRLKMKLGAPLRVRGVGSEASAYEVAPLRSTAGTTALPPIPMAVDLSMADELVSHPIDGLIGVDFFRDRVVQIDYVRRCLRLLPAKDSSAVGERLPITEKNGILCVPIKVNDSQARWTRLDTGCNDSLHWVVPRPNERAKRQGVSIGFVSDPDETSLMSVSLGSHSIEKVKTSLHGRELFEGEAGLLGNGLLSQFLVTIDWPRHQVLLNEAPRR